MGTALALLDAAACRQGYRGWPHALRALAPHVLGAWLQFGGLVSGLASAPSLLQLPEASAERSGDAFCGGAVDAVGWPGDGATGLPVGNCGRGDKQSAHMLTNGNASEPAASQRVASESDSLIAFVSDCDLFSIGGVHARADGDGAPQLLACAHAAPLPRGEESQEMAEESEMLEQLRAGRSVRSSASAAVSDVPEARAPSVQLDLTEVIVRGASSRHVSWLGLNLSAHICLPCNQYLRLQLARDIPVQCHFCATPMRAKHITHAQALQPFAPLLAALLTALQHSPANPAAVPFAPSAESSATDPATLAVEQRAVLATVLSVGGAYAGAAQRCE